MMTPTDVLGHFLVAFRSSILLDYLSMQHGEAKSCTPITLWALSLFCLAMLNFITFYFIISFVHTYGVFGPLLGCISLQIRSGPW